MPVLAFGGSKIGLAGKVRGHMEKRPDSAGFQTLEHSVSDPKYVPGQLKPPILQRQPMCTDALRSEYQLRAL